jgi:hypothetical protein
VHESERLFAELDGLEWLQQQQENRYDDTDSSISNVINESNSSSFIDETMDKHRQQMDELFRTIKEKREQKHQQEHSSNK